MPRSTLPPTQDEQALFGRLLAFVQNRQVGVGSLIAKGVTVLGDLTVSGTMTARRVKTTLISSFPRATGGNGVANGPVITNYDIDLRTEFGSFVGTTGPAGLLTIAYKQAFPNGVLSIVTTNGDANVIGVLLFPVQASSGRTSFTVLAVLSTTGATQNNTTVRVNYVAIGW